MTQPYLSVKDALARLPVRMAEREFRRRLRQLGLCYKHGHQLSLTEEHLARFIQTLECPQPDSSMRASTHKRTAAEALHRARKLLE
jgi:hypothetical protein